MRHESVRVLVRAGTLDEELAGLLSVLVEARSPVLVVSPSTEAAGAVADALADLLPDDARIVDVAPDDDFDWLPEAVELGWRRDRGTPVAATAPGTRLSPRDGVLRVRGLASTGGEWGADGVAGERARIVVRALALGYGLLATMRGDGLDDALNALSDPSVGADPDERTRLGIVLAVDDDAGTPLVTAAHYLRPLAVDPGGHVQREPPAVLATWSGAAGRWDHFAWGLIPELAGRLAVRPIDFEREQARRAADLAAAG
jgi:hypothetical protein